MSCGRSVRYIRWPPPLTVRRRSNHGRDDVNQLPLCTGNHLDGIVTRASLVNFCKPSRIYPIAAAAKRHTGVWRFPSAQSDSDDKASLLFSVPLDNPACTEHPANQSSWTRQFSGIPQACLRNPGTVIWLSGQSGETQGGSCWQGDGGASESAWRMSLARPYERGDFSHVVKGTTLTW